MAIFFRSTLRGSLLPSWRRISKIGALITLLIFAGIAPQAFAESSPKIRIGFWPIAAGLPFFVALDKGYFKEAGLDVESVKFAAPPQIVEAMIAGRLEGSANGTASAALAIGELASPGLVKIFASNPSNVKNVLDEFIVASGSTYKSIKDLAGKRIASGPGIQNTTLARTVLERNGVTDAQIVEVPIGQHVGAIIAGQVDAAYTLEPTGTVGRLAGATRVLEGGVIATYVLGDPMAPWFGGSASLTTDFIKKNPGVAKKYIAAYARGINFVRASPGEARKYLAGYTAIEGDLAKQVPLPAYTLHNEFTKSDIAMFQKFFDLFSDKKIFSARVMVEPMLYKGE
jgi:NitT/TauT family transport system substrate-binding protein